MEPEPPGAASFCLEPTQVGRSRSRLWDLGHPEPPKKVAAPQHWLCNFLFIFLLALFCLYYQSKFSKNKKFLLLIRFRNSKTDKDISKIPTEFSRKTAKRQKKCRKSVKI